MTDPHGDPRLSEERAALVLDRAAQLDASRGREVSASELREAALEAGISPSDEPGGLPGLPERT